jgi:hypothetical protein
LNDRSKSKVREGDERLSEHKHTSSEHKVESEDALETGAPAKSGRPKGKKGSDVGRALRSVYDSTLNEDVPDDFMDLLGKLG